MRVPGVMDVNPLANVRPDEFVLQSITSIQCVVTVINDAVLMLDRKNQSRQEQPSAAVIDSQTAVPSPAIREKIETP